VTGDAALAALDSRDPAKRSAALRLLAARPATPPIVEAVAVHLGDGWPAVRREAVAALLRLRSDLEPLRDTLLAIITDEREAVSWSPCPRCRAVCIDADACLHDLRSDDPGLREAALDRLLRSRRIAADHADEIAGLIADPDPGVRATLVAHVLVLGWTDATRAVMTRAMWDQDAGVRRSAAIAMGGLSDDTGVALLRGNVQDPDESVRWAVVRSLGRCGKAASPAAGEVRAMLRDRSARVRIAALVAIADLKLDDEKTLRETIRCLDEERPIVLTAALRALPQHGAAAAGAMPRLRVLIGHPSGLVRTAAVTAVWAAAPEHRRGEAVLLLVEALLDGDDRVREAAQKLLEQYVDRWRL
jgi:HEAT repeat protein